METNQIIGFLAAAFITIANIPQTYIIIREKSTQYVSATTYFILLIGTLLWVIYGIMRNDWPVIITNGISSATNLILLLLNFSSKRVIGKIHNKILPERIKKEAKKWIERISERYINRFYDGLKEC